MSLPIYRYNEVDTSNLEISTPIKIKDEEIMFINHFDKKRNMMKRILIESESIFIDNHGLKDSKKNTSINVPLDGKQLACINLESFLDKIDKFFSSTQTKLKMFGDNVDKYEYVPCISMGIDGMTNYCKMNFNFRSNENLTVIHKIKNKSKKKIIAKKMKDIIKNIPLNSIIKMIFHLEKVWIGQNPIEGQMTTLYGISIKIISIQIKN